MKLHAETIQVDKRRVEERVRVTRATQTKNVRVDAALDIHDVVVEHVYVGRFVDTVPDVREDGDTTILSIVEEVPVVVKRLFLREEIRITKTMRTAQHVETVVVREQLAHITRTPLAISANIEPAFPAQLNPKGIPNMEDEETIVAVYDTPAHAELAIGDLLEAKVPESAISRHKGSATGTAPVRAPGFWASLFGGAAEDEHVYEHSASSGSSVVAVRTPSLDADAVVAILESHHPVNLDERAASYQATESAVLPAATATIASSYASPAAATAVPPVTTGYVDQPASTAVTGDTVQLSEEELVVGKRLVNRGGTRLRRYVIETPVEAEVSLHTESVTIERRPVTDGRVVTPDFSEKTIEMTASAEEAVVGKTAHVVEEVSLRKQASDRVETVHDTVRKEEVEVEQIPAVATVGTAPVASGSTKI